MGNGTPRKKDSARVVWDSKPRRAPNPRDIEFQTAEIVIPNPQRDSGQIPLSFKDGRITDSELDKSKMNRLIWGDNLLAMQALLAQGYEGKINLIYIDPPFDSKADYSYRLSIATREVTKEPSVVERLAYKDTWEGGLDSYLDMLYPRLQLMRRLLADTGTIYVHVGHQVSHYVKTLLDEVFGRECFLNDIIWQRTGAHNDPGRYGNVAEDLLFYSKSEEWTWNPCFTEYSEEYIQERFRSVEQETGRRFWLNTLTAPAHGRPPKAAKFFGRDRMPPPGTMWRFTQDKITALEKQNRIVATESGMPYIKQYLDESPGRPLQNIWTDIPMSKSGAERVDFETQKPIALLERVISASSNPGDLVGDFFLGSGTTAVAAEKLGRRWVACELGKVGIQVSRGRLVQSDAKPLLVENIGNYQREMIYLSGKRIQEMILIILKLYGATCRPGTPELGTRKAPDDVLELVYVGYPDRPTTAKRVEELARTAEKLDGTGYKRLVVLAWDYDYNFSTELEKRLKTSTQKIRVSIEPRTIPPEIYEYLKKVKDEAEIESLREKIRFHEKPYFRLGKPHVGKESDAKIRVEIKIERYVLFDIPVESNEDKERLRQIAKDKFAALIDYWAIDWDYDRTTFRSQWQDLRGHGRKTKVVTTQAEHEFPAGKKYTIAVRVVDVFGNDAAETVEVDLR
jgi:adenine-specific DNA-methyltransferase